LGFDFRALGFGLWALGFDFGVSGFGFPDLGFGLWDLGFGLWGSGFSFWFSGLGLSGSPSASLRDDMHRQKSGFQTNSPRKKSSGSRAEPYLAVVLPAVLVVSAAAEAARLPL
jgi:hypothetical protein